MNVKKTTFWLVGLIASTLAFPTPTVNNVLTPAQYPGGLPSTYPHSPARINAQGSPPPVPTHFALFGYSYDGKIVNQSYFADGQPYNKDLWGFMVRPGDYGSQTFGSYAFGIGPHGYLFAQNDGRIATFNNNDGQLIDTMLLQSWEDWWEYATSGEPADHKPTCEVIPYYDVLYCTLDEQAFHFAWCNDSVPFGIGYSRDTVAWGTDISPCQEIVLQAVEVPFGYGDQDPAKACAAGEFPGLKSCEGKGTGKGNATTSTLKPTMTSVAATLPSANTTSVEKL